MDPTVIAETAAVASPQLVPAPAEVVAPSDTELPAAPAEVVGVSSEPGSPATVSTSPSLVYTGGAFVVTDFGMLHVDGVDTFLPAGTRITWGPEGSFAADLSQAGADLGHAAQDGAAEVEGVTTDFALSAHARINNLEDFVARQFGRLAGVLRGQSLESQQAEHLTAFTAELED